VKETIYELGIPCSIAILKAGSADPDESRAVEKEEAALKGLSKSESGDNLVVLDSWTEDSNCL
jgi:hypothetical protein